MNKNQYIFQLNSYLLIINILIFKTIAKIKKCNIILTPHKSLICEVFRKREL